LKLYINKNIKIQVEKRRKGMEREKDLGKKMGVKRSRYMKTNFT